MVSCAGLSAAHARALLNYDPVTGVLIWRRRDPSMFADGKQSAAHRCGKWNSRYAGTVAGALDRKRGYLLIVIGNGHYKAHRIAWLIMTGKWPKNHIDHIDGYPSNNRFANLREATNSENMLNRGMQSNNRSGVKGVFWECRRSKWCAQIKVRGKLHFIGYFPEDKLNDAAAAYAAAAKELHGEFARIE